MKCLNLFIPFLFTILSGCSFTDSHKPVSYHDPKITYDTTNIDSIEFKEAWNSFADAAIHNDIKRLRKLSTNCIYCTDCVTDTKYKDSLFTDFQNRNEKIWYDKFYNELSYIPADIFF